MVECSFPARRTTGSRITVPPKIPRHTQAVWLRSNVTSNRGLFSSTTSTHRLQHRGAQSLLWHTPEPTLPASSTTRQTTMRRLRELAITLRRADLIRNIKLSTTSLRMAGWSTTRSRQKLSTVPAAYICLAVTHTARVLTTVSLRASAQELGHRTSHSPSVQIFPCLGARLR